MGWIIMDLLTDPRELTEADFIAYLKDLDPRGGKRGAVLRTAKSYYSYAEGIDVEENPARRFKIRRARLTKAPRLSLVQMGRLVQAAATRGRDGPRRALGIMFVYFVGARVGSACGVRAEDVRDDRVFFRQAKNDDPYEIAIPPQAVQIAAALARIPNRRGTLLGVGPTQFWNWVSDAAKRAGFHVWPHLLRHTFASVVYEATKDPVLVAKMLNQKDLSQIRRYVHETDEEEVMGLAKAFGGA